MISLVKLEGAPDYSVCYVALNNELSEVFTDLTNQPSLPVPEHSNLKIVVKSSSDKLIGSVCINTSLLSPDIPQWLPLSHNNNILKVLPDKTYTPRILVLYCIEHLPAVQEVTENSSNECCGVDEHFWSVHEKNNFLRDRVTELELNILEKKWEFLQGVHEKMHFNLDVSQGIGDELERLRIKCDSVELIKSELQSRVDSLEILYKQERYQREYLDKQIIKITQDFEELLQIESKKVSDYKTELNSYTEKIKTLQESLASTSLKLKNCESERDDLKKQLLTSKNQQYGCEKCKMLQILQEKFEDSEFQRKILTEKVENILETKFSSRVPKTPVEKCTFFIEELNKIKELYSKSCKKINELESELETKAFNQQNREKVSDLLSQLNQKENSISVLQQSIGLKDKNFNELTVQLHAKDAELKSCQTFSENISKAKEGLESTVELLTEQIKLLSEKLASAKQLNYELSSVEKEKSINKSKLTSDNADERFSEYIKNYGVEHHFERVAEGVYSFGSKKVSITLKNGFLVCRVGGGYMMIEEFLRLFLGHEGEWEEEAPKRFVTSLLSPGNCSNKNIIKRFECESEGSQTERGFEYEYNYSNPMNGLKENTENSPSWHKMSPTSRQRSFTPLRKGMSKRIFK